MLYVPCRVNKQEVPLNNLCVASVGAEICLGRVFFLVESEKSDGCRSRYRKQGSFKLVETVIYTSGSRMLPVWFANNLAKEPATEHDLKQE